MGLNTLHNNVTVQEQTRMWTWTKGAFFLGDTAAECYKNMHPQQMNEKGDQ